MDLLGLSAMNQPSCRRCAFERDRAEQKTRECGCDIRLFAGGLDGDSESGLPVDSIGGKRMSSLFSCVSPTTNPAFTQSLLRGQTDAQRHGALLLLRFPSKSFRKEYRKHFDEPTVNAELGTWESAPLAWLRRV
jgi:hypothetical protein